MKNVAAYAVTTRLALRVLHVRDRRGGSLDYWRPLPRILQFNSLWYLLLAHAVEKVRDQRVNRVRILLVYAVTPRQAEHLRTIQPLGGTARTSNDMILKPKDHHARDRQ